MRTFNSAVLKNHKNPIIIEKFKFPLLAKGQVLVKIFYSGICRSQLMEKLGKRGKDEWLPHALGHEGSGKVIDAGKGVKKVKIGDNVILSWIKGKGIETGGFKIRNISNKDINFGPVTTLGNYTVVSENRVFLKPKKMNFKEAVLYGCAIPTGAGIIFNELNIKKNDSVLLIGVGGVGMSCLLALKAIGVKNVVIIEKNKNKLKDLKKFNIIYYKKNKHNNFDYCIECSGVAKMIELGLEKIKKTGTLMFASHPPQKDKIKILPHDLISGKKIFGTWGGSSKLDNDITRFDKIIKNKNISLNLFFSKIYKLKEINKAFTDLSKGKIIRAIIKMEHAK